MHPVTGAPKPRATISARRAGFVVASCLVVFGASACGALYDLAALGPGGAGDASDAALGADAAGVADAVVDRRVDEVEEEDSSAPCVGERGAMKRIGSYCIDAAEVTNAAYEAFLARIDGGVAPSPRVACASAGNHVPVENWPPPAAWRDLPVTGVSFCDADAFCASVGKRLCGRRGGGSLTPTTTAVSFADASANEWYRACSKAGANRLPYGDEAVVGECATVRQLRARSGQCEGGYRGIYDLVGNVEEWIDACSSEAMDATCLTAGGAALDTLADCTTAKAYARTFKRPLAGIRCCAD